MACARRSHDQVARRITPLCVIASHRALLELIDNPNIRYQPRNPYDDQNRSLSLRRRTLPAISRAGRDQSLLVP